MIKWFLSRFFRKLEKIYYLIVSVYLRIVMFECGVGLKVWGPVSLKNPGKFRAGKNLSLNDSVYINAMGGIILGDNVSLSAGCMLVSTGLDLDLISEKKSHVSGEISIGSNVQIGAGAIVLSGLKIGDRVVVGAGAVVTKDVPGECVVAGNPARVIRRLC